MLRSKVGWTSLVTTTIKRPSRRHYLHWRTIGGGTPLGLIDLLDVLRDAPRLTGWNTWWVPTRQAIKPYPSDGAIECWLGGDTSEHHQEHRDAASSDFWRITPDGRAFLLRGYQEDGDKAAQAKIQPGTCLDQTLPIWRIGEDSCTLRILPVASAAIRSPLLRGIPDFARGDWPRGQIRWRSTPGPVALARTTMFRY